MNPPSLPPHPTPIKAGLERFGVYGTRWAALAIVGLFLLWPLQPGRQTWPLAPTLVGPQAPLQEWSTSPLDALPFVGTALRGALPPPDPRQRKAPCDADVEVEAGGLCWVALKTPPPCPSGKAFEHGGQCLMRVLRVVPPPTSGEVRAGNVAGEP